MTLSQEKTRSATDLKHERLHEELVRYLKENLADPSLSLESTAARFNLSTGYLGKLVKASSGDTFSSMLAAMRLEKAADLLLTTNQPAYKVAELVGIPMLPIFQRCSNGSTDSRPRRSVRSAEDSAPRRSDTPLAIQSSWNLIFSTTCFLTASSKVLISRVFSSTACPSRSSPGRPSPSRAGTPAWTSQSGTSR